MEKLSLSEIKIDWDIYPRTDLNRDNTLRLIDSLSAGAEIPPPLIDLKTKTLVDGFHRYHAYLEKYGKSYCITVTSEDFKDKKEMLLRSARVNSIHGQPLSNQDKTKCIVIAEKMGLKIDRVAQSLSITKERVRKLYERRIEEDTQPATQKLKEKKNTTNGRIIELYVNIIIHSIKKFGVVKKKDMQKLLELRDFINNLLEDRK